jgi:hypothetical protein
VEVSQEGSSDSDVREIADPALGATATSSSSRAMAEPSGINPGASSTSAATSSDAAPALVAQSQGPGVLELGGARTAVPRPAVLKTKKITKRPRRIAPG